MRHMHTPAKNSPMTATIKLRVVLKSPTAVPVMNR